MRTIIWLLMKHILRITRWNEFKYGRKTFKHIFRHIFIGIAFLILAFMWNYNIYEIMSSYSDASSYVEYILFPLVVSAILFTIYSSAIKGVGILYFGQDLKMLFSMPIKIYQIVLSRFILIGFYVIGIDILLVFPSLLFYGIFHNFMLGFFVINFMNICIITVIPVFVGICLGIIIYRIIKLIGTDNLKAKAIFQIAVLILFLFFIVFANVYKEGMIKVLQFLFGKTQFCIKYFYELFIIQREVVVWSWILILMVAGAAFGLITITYQRISYMLSRNDKKNKTLHISLVKKHNQLITLVMREKERFFSIPIYVLNSMLGIVMLLVYILVMFFAHHILRSYVSSINTMFFNGSITLGISNIFIITTCTGLTNITSSSISIEGRKRKILKAYPIEATKFFQAKILFELLLTIPVIVVTNSIAIVVLRLNMIESIMGYAFPIAFAIFSSLVGCLLNIYFPKYDWDNVAYIVKQSAAAILGVFVKMGIVFISFYVVCRCFNNSIIISLSVLFLAVLLLDFIIIILFALDAEKFYENI